MKAASFALLQDCTMEAVSGFSYEGPRNSRRNRSACQHNCSCKDITAAHDCLQTIAKFSPTINKALQEKEEFANYTPEVREKLLEIRQTDAAYAHIRELTMAYYKKVSPEKYKRMKAIETAGQG